MPGQGMVPEQDVVIAFSIKELFVEIRDEIRAMNVKLDEKASLADLQAQAVRVDAVEARLNENDAWRAGLKGYMLGAAVGGGLASGGVIAGLLQVLS